MTRQITLIATVFAHSGLLAVWHHPYWFVLSCLSLAAMLLVTFSPTPARRQGDAAGRVGQ